MNPVARLHRYLRSRFYVQFTQAEVQREIVDNTPPFYHRHWDYDPSTLEGADQTQWLVFIALVVICLLLNQLIRPETNLFNIRYSELPMVILGLLVTFALMYVAHELVHILFSLKFTHRFARVGRRRYINAYTFFPPHTYEKKWEAIICIAAPLCIITVAWLVAWWRISADLLLYTIFFGLVNIAGSVPDMYQTGILRRQPDDSKIYIGKTINVVYVPDDGENLAN